MSEKDPIRLFVSTASPDADAVIRKGIGTSAQIETCPALEAREVSDQIVQGDYHAVLLHRPQCDPDLIRLIETLGKHLRVAVIVFVDTANGTCDQAIVRSGAAALIVDGLMEHRIEPVLGIAMERFRVTEALHSELMNVKNSLAARKDIERAKGLLMKRHTISEQQAYEALRNAAMSQRKPIHEVARTILSLDELLP